MANPRKLNLWENNCLLNLSIDIKLNFLIPFLSSSLFVNLSSSLAAFLVSFPHITIGAVAVSIEESGLYFVYGAATFVSGILGGMVSLLTLCYSVHIMRKTDLANEDEMRLSRARGGSGLEAAGGDEVTRKRSRSVVVTAMRDGGSRKE